MQKRKSNNFCPKSAFSVYEAFHALYVNITESHFAFPRFLGGKVTT